MGTKKLVYCLATPSENQIEYEMKIFCSFTLLLFFIGGKVLSQDTSLKVFHLDSLPANGIVLDKGWKFHAGDNPEWVSPGFDDTFWSVIDPTNDIHDIPNLWKTSIGWFRLRFTIDSSLVQKQIALQVEQTGASEIFLNSVLVERFGKITDNSHQVQAVTPVFGSFMGLSIKKPGEQILAVRFEIQKNLPYIVFGGRPNVALSLRAIETRALVISCKKKLMCILTFYGLAYF